ncbi:MAG: hypothetical protein CME26_00695 [Gemmatimonadetes bacterium]|nr:hypothetical protein [Gemmatimonadota bacterium]
MNPITPSSTDPNLSRWVDDLVSDSPRLVDDVEALSSSFDRSNSLDLVDRFLDLGQGLDLTDLSKEELAEAFEVIAELLERGIVGYEVREINGAPHKVFIDVATGSDLHRAPLWRNGRVDGYL